MHGGGGTGSGERKKARIEIIPLIDVIFFLLATFVLFTLSLNKSAGLPVLLPTSETSIPRDPSGTVTLTVTSKKGKKLWSLAKAGQPTNKALTVSYKLKKSLKTGTYAIVCSSTDLAGNVQAKATKAKLKVT